MGPGNRGLGCHVETADTRWANLPRAAFRVIAPSGFGDFGSALPEGANPADQADPYALLVVLSLVLSVTWSLDWNLGPGWEELFLRAYGADRDSDRFAFYRLLYDVVS